MRRRGGGRACARTALALCLLALGAPSATAGEIAAQAFRYGWSPGQIWLATQRIERETRLADDVQRDHGVARFEYAVRADESGEGVRLEVRMLSQETAAGVSPLDFSAIQFHARIDVRGRQRGAHYVVDEGKQTADAGAGPDALALRRLLRQAASAWRGAVFWFPEFPERALAPGQAFVVEEERDLPDEGPGLAMRVRSTRSYRLVSVEQGVARFRVEESSKVDAATSDSALASMQTAEGEALFDLSLGMWTRHQLVSDQRARYGATGEDPSGEASSRSVTTIEMQRAGAPR